uniref:PRA1 family protein n=1 Tax=Homo sapiens TaxID=9606 RepID=B4DWQ6_HUMAN|nr:unnamed protein product [Homo sapiens]
MDVNIAPLRAWDDFFPGSDRFARPDFRDISKWNNRVVSNLLYYQTNYLVVAAMMISIVGFLSPFNMILGGIVVVLVFTGFVWAAHDVRYGGHVGELFPYLHVWRSHGLCVWHYFSFAVDVYPCIVETSEPQEQTGE